MPAIPDLNARLIRREELGPGNVVLRVVPEGWGLPPFVPGQYTVLGMPASAPRSPLCDPDTEPPAKPEKLIKRAYSIASSSVQAEYLEFYVATVRSGALTPRLYNLGIGDRLWMSPKIVGHMTLEKVPPGADVILIATGTGLAPYMSMVRTLVQSGGIDRRIAVIHGARHSWDLGYQAELQTLAALSPSFTYVPVISEPAKEPAEWRGMTGFVLDAWDRGPIAARWGGRPVPGPTHVFLCGHPQMIESALVFLGDLGYRQDGRDAPGTIHFESYW